MNVSRRAAIALLLVAGVFLFSSCGQKKQTASDTPKDVPAAAPVYPDPVTVSLVAVGDNLIHDTIYQQAKGRSTDGGYDFAFAYQNIAPYIKGHDFAFVNQETLISANHPPANYPCFNSPTQVGQQLVDMGFNVINHSNNHMFDKGDSGLKSTIDFWRQQPVCLTGAYENEEVLAGVEKLVVKDVSIGFIGCTESTNGLNLPAGSQLRYISTKETELLAKKIAAAKAQCDLVAVSVHWGAEGTHAPTDFQNQFAQWLTDQGVDLILGSHSHTIQPIVWLDGVGGNRTLCIYSLGNFISSQAAPINMLAGMMDLKITKNYETKTTAITSALFTPLVTHYLPGMRQITVYNFLDYTPQLAGSHGVKSYGAFSYDTLKSSVVKNIDPQFFSDQLKGALGLA